jgi:hypothetical protein
MIRNNCPIAYLRSRYRLSFRLVSKASIVSLSTPAPPAFAFTALYASYTNRFGMVYGFVVFTGFLLLPVELAIRPLDPSPLLRPHYQPSSLLQGGPSQCCASVLLSHGGCRLYFSLDIATTGSRSSAQEPGLESRPLYAGCRLPNNQVSGKLVPEDRSAPGFDNSSVAYDASSEGSLSFVSANPYLLEVSPQRFDSNAYHHGSLPQQLGVV